MAIKIDLRFFTNVDRYCQTDTPNERAASGVINISRAMPTSAGRERRRQQSIQKGQTASDVGVNKGRVGVEKGDCDKIT